MTSLWAKESKSIRQKKYIFIDIIRQKKCKFKGVIRQKNVIFDENTLESLNKGNPSNTIVSFAWSKKHGLVQYTFQDGTSFNRINID